MDELPLPAILSPPGIRCHARARGNIHISTLMRPQCPAHLMASLSYGDDDSGQEELHSRETYHEPFVDLPAPPGRFS